MVLVTQLDRLARSTRDLLNILDKIGKAGAQFKLLRETWADTTTPVGKLMITIIWTYTEPAVLSILSPSRCRPTTMRCVK